jgi:hypothetical protein
MNIQVLHENYFICLKLQTQEFYEPLRLFVISIR